MADEKVNNEEQNETEESPIAEEIETLELTEIYIKYPDGRLAKRKIGIEWLVV